MLAILKELIRSQAHNAETADFLYHLFVLLEANNIKIEEVMNELKSRQQKSGLEEKINRY